MLWRASGLSSLEEYLESSLGIRQSLFPTVLGLKLAEDLDIGKRFKPTTLVIFIKSQSLIQYCLHASLLQPYLHDFFIPSEFLPCMLASGANNESVPRFICSPTEILLAGKIFRDILTLKESRRVEDRMVWVKTDPERSPITFIRSPDVLVALKSMAARCFRLPSLDKRCLQLSGVTLSSPVTFFLAFLHMAATFKESAEQVLCYVEECLPSVRLFQKRACTKACGLSWNVLKCLAGLSPGVVLKVEVHVTFPTSALSRNTPVVQAVLFEDPTDARFLKVWPVSQLEQRTFHRPVHLFYNNVRYDPDQKTVSLLVLETDWKALHAETVLILISSSVNYTSNAVKLKPGCKSSTNNSCCLANETVDVTSKNNREMDALFRSKRRKSRISCVRMSCVSDYSSSGLQKYDSCYQLQILSSQDIIIHNTGHMHKSTDCLVAEERQTKAPVRLFQTGIDSPSYQLKDDVSLEKKVVDDVIIHNGGHAIEDDGHSCRVTATVERVDDVTQLFGLLDVTLVTHKDAKTDQLEVE
ncbi:hypothetical protein OS493_030436 [Desmophyllum pertusum]|uniref:Uncharacterized protein n=1 Tax=Desmophyllum pertusum TaxID=174260 RepID=A0A9X0CXM8_9CNID|nr:hypothetical protein OS493_030436 [Desmophyllum pertusum]